MQQGCQGWEIVLRARLKEKYLQGLCEMKQRCCWPGQRACCSAKLIGTSEPHWLLYSDGSCCVNLFALIGPQRWKTKWMFHYRPRSIFKADAQRVLSLEASGLVIKHFKRNDRGTCVFSAIVIKGQVPCGRSFLKVRSLEPTSTGNILCGSMWNLTLSGFICNV